MDIIKEIAETHPHKVVLSNGKGEYKKIVFARKVLKGRNAYQLEKYTQTQVFHENIEEGRLAEHIAMHFPAEFKQMKKQAKKEIWQSAADRRRIRRYRLAVTTARRNIFWMRGWIFLHSGSLEYLPKKEKWFLPCMISSARSTALSRW